MISFVGVFGRIAPLHRGSRETAVLSLSAETGSAMAGVKSVHKDKVTDAMIVDYVRRWAKNGGRVTTVMIAEQFRLNGNGLLGRLKKITQLEHERLASLGNIWKVKGA